MSPKVKLYDKLPWTQGLVLDLPLYLSQLGSAGKVLDRTRYHNNGIVTGALWTPQGRWFDGIDDQISIPAAAAITGASDRTIIGWMKPDDFTTARALMEYGIYTPQNYFNLRLTPYLQALFNTTNFFSSLVGAAGVFNFIAFTLSGGVNATLYLNESSESTVLGTALNTSSSTILMGVTPLLLAGIGSSNKMLGTIGGVWIFNRVLSAAEIANIYLMTKWRYS